MLDLTSRKDLVPLAEALAPLARQASALGVEWILFGAQARDLVIEAAGLRPIGRATHDVDVAVEVGTWNEYEDLCGALVRKEGASHDPNVPHRLRLEDQTLLDLVPFKEIDVDGILAWPPHGDIVLRVVGLADAKRTATSVILPSGLHILVPSLPVYTCLELLAWESRHAEGIRRDAADLAGILSSLDELVPLDELYSHHAAVMEASDYDPAHACTQVLGQRMAAELSRSTRTAVGKVLSREALPQGRLELVQR